MIVSAWHKDRLFEQRARNALRQNGITFRNRGQIGENKVLPSRALEGCGDAVSVSR